MNRTGKLSYAPGIISLIGLFIIYPYCYKRIAHKNIGLIEINVPIDDDEDIPYLKLFSEKNIENEVNDKIKIVFKLDEDRITNLKKIKLIRSEALKLKFQNDTSTVIVAALTDSTNYETIVQLLNICQLDKHKRFALLEKSFIIFGEGPPDNIIKPILNFESWGNDLIPPTKKEIKTNLIYKISNKIKPYLNSLNIYLILGWFPLAISHIYFRKKLF